MNKVAQSLLAATLTLLGSTSMLAVSSPQTLNLPDAANYSFDDEDEPEVKARVARISFLSGEAKIKRNGVDEWERAVLNLPLVEGDEIATDLGTRLEIQFDKSSHARLDENAYLRIVSLKDEAIALSLSLGTMAVRVTAFDKDRSSFEIDAPKTTIALQRSGAYRIDAGRDGDSEISVAAREGGEARVYSDNVGFTLKNGRSARIYIDGANVGEWSSGDASRFDDDFERWTGERERGVAQSLSTAHYDKYYDNDIYGADDLNNDGEWLNIGGYGQVWRPYNSSTSRYADWSPYRYGQWRWMPPYGWIWVNDEPWGWATYHHGRWFHHHGRWHWSPYSYYRPRRSWWFPALVSINIFGGNTCWYPLAYRHRWRNYNAHYNIRNPRGIRYPKAIIDPRIARNGKGVEIVDDVPIGGITVTPTDTFGTGKKPFQKASTEIAKSVLIRKTEIDKLPDYNDVSRNLGRGIAAEKPKAVNTAVAKQTGVGIRKADTPMDRELREKVVLGGGRTVKSDAGQTEVKADPRNPGVFERPPLKTDSGIVKNSPREPQTETKKEAPVRKDSPVITERPKETPRYTPPPVRETPRYTPPVRETPKSTPPPSKPTRIDPSVKRDNPPEKKSPPPTKDSGEIKRSKPVD